MFQERGILVPVLIFLGFGFSACIDTITLTQPVKDGDLLVSNGETFSLGFFSPANSSDRYVGIWYHKILEKTIVWVANRDNLITNSSGILSIDPTGNFVLQEKDQGFVFWSTNISREGNDHDFSARLLDSGNFVLFQGTNKEVYSWQSLDYPSNTYLPGMKLGLDRKTGLNRVISSWKSTGNPGMGDCSWKLEFDGSTQMFLVKGMTRIWRGGSWTGPGFSGIPLMVNDPIIHPIYINDDDEVVLFFQMRNWSSFTRFVVTESGTVDRLIWNNADRKWIGFWSAPKDQCDGYNHCGPFSICDSNIAATFECDCLPGYEPHSPQDWRIGDGSKGCIRKVATQICKAGDGFVELAKVKVPDTSMARVNMSLGLEACKELCLRNCTCMGYASGDISKASEGGGCITWYGDMNDIRKFTDGGQSFYVRVDANELAKYSSKRPSKSNTVRYLLFGMLMIAAGFVLCISIYCYVKKKNGNRNKGEVGFDFSNSLKTLEGSYMEKDIGKNVDLDVFDLRTIAVATDNFSPVNKLGEGGFGSVYKAKLLNGQEVAIKRLSQSSGQGMQEFKNEVLLIAKLQHRNLVRLLGYCFYMEEKMLVYEYLPNKGLDSFIFDPERATLLDWKKRFQIIQGIMRGLLYLHHDSRLRIIHRDLKASNVSLDTDFNPKISDFGLAKIFGGDNEEAKTRKVVGTYGYMSPEYAMEGLFSIKSDVFSFGVLVMEIISGRKNNSYYKEKSLNLIGHVWDLWKQDKALDVVDSSLGDSFDAREVLLCIHVGILCVQESASDRPTMTDVAFMLSNHETMLPTPNQPAFIFRQLNYGRDVPTMSASGGVVSVNEETITTVHGR
ncbi:G-type lectin S-receptor-like serine/threonine-protein kinase At1g11410 [Bidens hawaiensis]|uniref:G-type lectin S-receptor-like serine/threonine-protein kinase At1g11410 n=1 Tax=Bidens hawaiensis TaxID=980011 RepID=UPI00404963CE